MKQLSQTQKDAIEYVEGLIANIDCTGSYIPYGDKQTLSAEITERYVYLGCGGFSMVFKLDEDDGSETVLKVTFSSDEDGTEELIRLREESPSIHYPTCLFNKRINRHFSIYIFDRVFEAIDHSDYKLSSAYELALEMFSLGEGGHEKSYRSIRSLFEHLQYERNELSVREVKDLIRSNLELCEAAYQAGEVCLNNSDLYGDIAGNVMYDRKHGVLVINDPFYK